MWKKEKKSDFKESLNEATEAIKDSIVEAGETTKKHIITMRVASNKTFKKVGKKLIRVKDTFFQSEKEELRGGLISISKRKLGSIPLSIRTISISLFLFLFGWGLGAEAYFSVYIKSIVNSVFWVSLIGAILPLSQMLFALPIGELNNDTDRKSVIFLSKIMYVLCGISFFLAGILHNHWLLIVAVIFNGMASATLYITYESYIRTTIDKEDTEKSWGLYFSSMNAALVIGSLISAILIKWVSLPYLFLFIALFAIISLFSDKKIPIIRKEDLKKIFGKDSFLMDFIKRVFSLKPFVKTFSMLKSESKSFVYSLGFEGLYQILSHIGFLFIPLVAMENNLSLSQIALLFALMKLPHLSNVFTANWSKSFDKKLFIATALVFLSFLYAFLAFEHSFGGIMLASFGIAFGLSIIRPAISSLISSYSNKENSGSITGLQTFTSGIGKIAGSIGFGIISAIFGIQIAFFVVGLGTFVLAIRGISKKTKNKVKVLRLRKIISGK